MKEIFLIGIGTGNPEHVTMAARRAMGQADLILIPRKGANKADLADLRREICVDVLGEAARVVEFDLPRRGESGAYLDEVNLWHDAIAGAWAAAAGRAQRVALLIWGDPSLYDSSLRIAGRLDPAPKITVIPGITALQALTAAHAIAVNEIGAPFVVTTGRRLREAGFPADVDTAAVMLDGECSFQKLPADQFDIWWGGFLGMENEVLEAGPLTEAGPRILRRRAAARAAHGWIMDIYLLRRKPAD